MELPELSYLFLIIVSVYGGALQVFGAHGDNNNNRGEGRNHPFRVVWNIPSEGCKDLGVDINVKQYGIEENARNGWTGEVITIFYGVDIGLYPEVLPNGSLRNGGIPQRVSLAEHVRKCEQDIVSRIPDPDFSGLGVIDFEAWRPLWERNWDSKTVYQNLSKALVRQQHPDWSLQQVTEEAQRQFEQAARNFMLATLQTAKRLRPHGKWGFYLFPECYNYHGARKCPRSQRLANNRLLWLFNASTALFPSAYLSSSQSVSAHDNFVYGELHETARLRRKLTDRYKPIYLYSRIRYHPSETWYSMADLNSTLWQAHDLRMNGVVLWDDNHLHDNRTMCEKTKHYVDTILGPYVQQLKEADGRPTSGIVWSNRHSIANPFNKRFRCRTDPCIRTRPHRNNGQLEVVIFENQ